MLSLCVRGACYFFFHHYLFPVAFNLEDEHLTLPGSEYERDANIVWTHEESNSTAHIVRTYHTVVTNVPPEVFDLE